MNPIVSEFNKGYGHCIFMSREADSIAKTITERADKAFSDVPAAIKVTPVDELHDKLSLTLRGGNVVEGTLQWHKSVTGAHYVLDGLTTPE